MALPKSAKFVTFDMSLHKEPEKPPFKFPTRCMSCGVRNIGCACVRCLLDKRFEVCKVCLTYTLVGKLHEYCESLLKRIPMCTCCVCHQSKAVVDTIRWTPYGLNWKTPQFAVCQRAPDLWWYESPPVTFADICLDCFGKYKVEKTGVLFFVLYHSTLQKFVVSYGWYSNPHFKSSS